MIVIADTTPINYLILIDQAQILHELFGQVVIPQAVLKELQSAPAPDAVHQWLASCPDWLVVETVKQRDPTLAHLDEGECEVISLAQEVKADLIVLDEHRGRQTAISRGLNVTGTVGLLDRAGARGLIDVPAAIARLRKTRFRISPQLLNAVLARYKTD